VGANWNLRRDLGQKQGTVLQRMMESNWDRKGSSVGSSVHIEERKVG